MHHETQLQCLSNNNYYAKTTTNSSGLKYERQLIAKRAGELIEARIDKDQW